jgi:hypothetical protein
VSLESSSPGGDTPHHERRLKFTARHPNRRGKPPPDREVLFVHPDLPPNRAHPLSGRPASELREAMIRDLARVLYQIAKRSAGVPNPQQPSD